MREWGKRVGIVAEYDPFHCGHEAQLRMAREAGAEFLLVAMSCDVVQRGRLALLPPQIRAAAAVEAGADMVLALPNPYACTTAEQFAMAGVAVLAAAGADTLCFGAETPEAGLHTELAALLETKEFSAELKKELATGQGFAFARQAAVERLRPELAILLRHPNDILGVEYCKAIRRQKAEIQPMALPRLGAEHGEAPLHGYASAGWLRQEWQRAGGQALRDYVPEKALERYLEAEREGMATDRKAEEIAILSRLRSTAPEGFGKVRGTAEGLDNRLAQAVQQAGSLEQLYQQMKTKRYSHARLRRLALDAALGCTDDLPPLPPYLQVLAARRSALPVMKSFTLPAGTSLATLEKESQAAAAVARAHSAATDLAALCRREPCPMGLAYTTPAVLL